MTISIVFSAHSLEILTFALMKLSIVIVNYNVEHFLEQCLLSVRQALKGVDAEVFVVDNNSVDGSVHMVRQKFPEVILIDNKENLGFSKANNQAIRQSSGQYVLLLNPDTVVEETTFTKIVTFMDETPDAGGLGVMMVDGKGNFLPESKRGLPTPEVSFYKIFGLAALFPNSRRFGKYHLTYLDKTKTHEVDVLSGAFMLLRRETLDKTGLLDETFFMYGEDIDLSYRILKAGYKNYYFPETRIIHYKGESTKKSSANYVFVFYNAMIIFARKHYAREKLRLFVAVINIAIYFRAGLALLSRFMKRVFLPLIDVTLIASGLYVISNLWQQNVLFPNGGRFPDTLLGAGLATYTLLWILFVFLSGGYNKPVRLTRIVRGLLIGTGLILIGYSLLPEAYRFSRAIILLGAAWATCVFIVSRLVAHVTGCKSMRLAGTTQKRTVIVGEQDEAHRVRQIMDKAGVHLSFVHFVAPNENSSGDEPFGRISQLGDIVQIFKINEIIFCARDISAEDIISIMAGFPERNIEFRIAPPESLYVIGSNNINHPGDLYMVDINNISKPDNKRNKRIFDVNSALLLLLFSPLLMWFMKRPPGLIINALKVIFGFRSWVGFNRSNPLDRKLPAIRRGILNPVDLVARPIDNPATIDHLNILYARDYKVWNDVQIMVRSFRSLGRP